MEYFQYNGISPSYFLLSGGLVGKIDIQNNSSSVQSIKIDQLYFFLIMLAFR